MHSKKLSEVAEMGESLKATESLLESTISFQASVDGDINEALELEQVGRDIAATNVSAIDSVEPKCIELSRMASHFRFVVEEKLNKQREWREVQFTIEKVDYFSFFLKLCASVDSLYTASLYYLLHVQ